MVGNTVPTHQQSMGVDAIRRTGDQCTEILALLDGQSRYIARFYDQDLIHFIGQHLIQNANDKGISLHELIQIGKELCAGQSPVSGEDTVGTLSATGRLDHSK